MAERAASLLLIAALAGCGAAATNAPTKAPDPTTTPSAAPGAVLFTGTAVCNEDASVSPAPVASGQPVPGHVVCDRTFTDPRLTGKEKITSYVAGDVDLSIIWGSGTISNDGGLWTCTQLIQGTMRNQVGSMEEVCVGTDGYAGLTAYIHGTTPNQASDFGLIGWIETEAP
jgi:hypothetical protein